MIGLHVAQKVEAIRQHGERERDAVTPPLQELALRDRPLVSHAMQVGVGVLDRVVEPLRRKPSTTFSMRGSGSETYHRVRRRRVGTKNLKWPKMCSAWGPPRTPMFGYSPGGLRPRVVLGGRALPCFTYQRLIRPCCRTGVTHLLGLPRFLRLSPDSSGPPRGPASAPCRPDRARRS